MPPDDTVIAHANLIRSEVVACHSCWGAWKRLYMDDDAIKVRYAANAAKFFHIIRDSILDDVLLTLARMLDDPVQGGNQNLVVSELVRHLGLPDGSTDAESAREAEERLAEFRKKVEVVRHKRLAHNDREVVVKHGPVIHYIVSDDEVDDALDQLRTIMGLVDRQFPPERQTHYDTQIGFDAAGRVIDLIAHSQLTA